MTGGDVAGGLRLALGPIQYHWPRQRMLEFYREIEAAPEPGLLFEKLRRPDDALNRVQRALSLEPEHAPGLKLEGEILVSLDRPDEAYRSFQQAYKHRSHDPEILCLDEFSIAVDPVTTMRIEDVLADLKTNITIILVTNLVQQAHRLADRVAFFNQGRLVEVGDIDTIFGEHPREQMTFDYVRGNFG